MTAVIVIEPASSGASLIAAAARLGVAAHVFSANRDERVVLPALRNAAASFTVVDTASPDAVAATARAMRVDAIVPGFEYTVGVAAQAAARLGLPHLPPEAAALTQDKYHSRLHLATMGLAVPQFAQIADPRDILTAASQVGFPAVLKPVDGCGSQLVTRVNSLAELQFAVERAMHQGVVDMGRKIGNVLLLEQYLEGPEYSIEGYIDGRGPRVVAVTEKLLSAEPYFVEMGHTVEAALTPEHRAALVAYIEKITARIGLTLGVFHAEARITRDGPVLIEIAARLGGDRIYRLVELSKSLSLPEVMIRSHLGDANPAPGYDTEVTTCASGVRFLAPVTGRFASAAAVERVRAMPGFEEIEVHSHIGGAVPHPTDFRGRAGHLLFTAADRPTLDLRLAEAQSALRFNRTLDDI
ncbi:ATP-grasp domain-containing protein [Paraburkholderia phenoliruptrix]|uniref:Phosphoribosylglycinamide synthetase ATP-grasp (A) domain protein n=2 Tax=Paraburkholderia phenoliruptrix TaxID=252970 RepID=K0E3Y2_9BURK|nr:ATP-grasp domain-containing protein [Paraburkholderia phenoliruptrix]AFT90564.1 phosphoribosylglycinamide synthetase ATP-grasp (A) domain protein [Paraburkholderia phenoliruptrix BR3459a]CAB4052897.1 N5-carboxyaminoimidazole ribonucleotide synthase [Paraburkholderia phenoliruptrix]